MWYATSGRLVRGIDRLDSSLRAPGEQALTRVAVVFCVAFWGALLLSGAGTFSGLALLAFAWAGRALMLARIRGNGVHLSERQMPELNARCNAAAARLGVRPPPETYVIQADGALSTLALRVLSRDFMVLHADLLERCEDPRQVDFLIGHEMGHLAAGHYRASLLLAPFLLIPWVGPALGRARQYTADRCGLAISTDLDASLRALGVLAAGRVAARLELSAFGDPSRESEDFWSSVYELVSPTPLLARRAAALRANESPINRPLLSYPLAPLAGLGSGTPSSTAILVSVYLALYVAASLPSIQRMIQTTQHHETPAPPVQAPREAEAPTAQEAPPAQNDRGGYAIESLPDETVEPGITRHALSVRRPGKAPTRFWVYQPDNAAPSPPLVLVPPAGGSGVTGMGLASSDMPEQLPWARAGFIVVSVEIDGAPPENDSDDAAWSASARAYRASNGGMSNFEEALDVAMSVVPTIDPAKVMVAGHSSAATQALVFAARDPRVRQCVSFSPVLDWREVVNPRAQEAFGAVIPDLQSFLEVQSPIHYEETLRVPVFLTAAPDERPGYSESIEAFATSLRRRGVEAEFHPVGAGGHYAPMIRDGIPAGIAWARARFGLTPQAPQRAGRR